MLDKNIVVITDFCVAGKSNWKRCEVAFVCVGKGMEKVQTARTRQGKILGSQLSEEPRDTQCECNEMQAKRGHRSSKAVLVLTIFRADNAYARNSKKATHSGDHLLRVLGSIINASCDPENGDLRCRAC